MMTRALSLSLILVLTTTFSTRAAICLKPYDGATFVQSTSGYCTGFGGEFRGTAAGTAPQTDRYSTRRLLGKFHRVDGRLPCRPVLARRRPGIAPPQFSLAASPWQGGENDKFAGLDAAQDQFLDSSHQPEFERSRTGQLGDLGSDWPGGRGHPGGKEGEYVDEVCAMLKALIAGLGLAILAGQTAIPAPAFASSQEPIIRDADRVLVVRNENSRVSRAVADDYSKRRTVANVLSVRCPDSTASPANETVSFSVYQQDIEKPLRRFLTAHLRTLTSLC